MSNGSDARERTENYGQARSEPGRPTSDLREIIDQARVRLLDLTARNRLLSFQHPRAGCLRVVGVPPGQLCKALLGGMELRFAPVPVPTMDELLHFHATQRGVPAAELEDADLPTPAPEDWARHRGIPTDYALPTTQRGAYGATRTDRALQTLLYRSVLDTRLRTVRSAANRAEEETGSNFLHLAVGFLEWRQPSGARRPALAPLLLVPASLRRAKTRGGRYEYFVSWSGEEMQSNLCLEKKLLDEFSLELPALTDEVDAEAYLASVAKVIRDQGDWCVRRFATLALFDFGRLLMYRDLDPDAWPPGKGPTESGLIGRMLTGEGGECEGAGKPVFAATPDHADLDLELVTDCDSSQASALQRALAGESMIIQGPPGTGKSQTITNLIAAALARGRTVLFVAEKLAALEVVRRRLDELNLGDFALELHSHKSRGQAVVRDLEKRLDRTDDQATRRANADTPELLARHRAKLQRYVEIMRTPLGATGLTVSDVLFESGRARLRLADAVSVVPAVDGTTAEAVTAADRDEAHRALHAFATAVERAAGDTPLARHPWAGVSARALVGRTDEAEVLALGRGWDEALGELATGLDGVCVVLGVDLPRDESLADCTYVLAEAADELRATRAELEIAAQLCARIFAALALPAANGPADLLTAARLLDLADQAPAHDFSRQAFCASDADQALGELRCELEDADRLRQRVRAHLRPDALRDIGAADLRSLAAVLRDPSWLRLFKADWRGARKRVLSMCVQPRPDWASIPDVLLEAARVHDAEQAYRGDPRAVEMCGPDPEAALTRLGRAQTARDWCVRVQRCFGRGLGDGAAVGRALLQASPETLLDIASVVDSDEGSALRRMADQFAALAPDAAGEGDPWRWYLARRLAHAAADVAGALDQTGFERLIVVARCVQPKVQTAREAAQAFAVRVGLDEECWHRGVRSDLRSQAARLREALMAPDRLSDWLDVDLQMQRVGDPRVRALMMATVQGRLAVSSAADAYDFLLFEALARGALERFEELRNLAAGDQDALRREYAQCDRRRMELRRAEIAAVLLRRPVPAGATGARVSDLTELKLVRHEIGKTTRHLPVRQLLGRAGRALQAVKPCFMMGPYSVAQYLTRGKLEFDLVVFDEASQLRPEQALGALARARQAVVVGDSRQLPPTPFFERSGEGDEPDEDAALLTATDSILESAESRLPAEMLRWHYRSRDPSLIAFSNHRFYDGKLILFPSPYHAPEASGVRFHHVRDGAYASSRNQVEAESVVESVLRHLRERSHESLGVVAMNSPQRDLIEELLERRLRQAGVDIDAAPGGRREDRLFVKNLENVQGDERDVIFISMTYGPSEPGGRVLQRFGPINGVYGWRRLNVLFSRARLRMEVFSSMLENDVTPSDTGQRGPHELKAFLRYARIGVLDHHGQPTPGDRPADSDFELAVAEGLRRHGYALDLQVGAAGFYIDIGVRHPDKPGAYLAGVECDGATYHSTQSARDRDRLRQEVLERLGWSIERVWSTDWFRNPERELQRLLDRLEGVRRRDAVVTPPAQEPVPDGATATAADVVRTLVLPRRRVPPGPVERPSDDPSAPTPRGFGRVRGTPGHLPRRGRAEPEQTRPRASPSGPVDVSPDERHSGKDDSLSIDQARSALLALRERAAGEQGAVPSERALLRDEMLDALLKALPMDIAEFRELIPRHLRMGTAPSDMQRHADTVFDVLQRVT